jgi:DNA (cytosine-5)-methyltransferase 1
MNMKHGSLFSGIGGFDLAAEWMGWNNIFHCEWNEFNQRVLKLHFPNAISYSDITKTDFRKHENAIDIISGGFPCQPYSLAGKRKGKDDERHLWPEMLRAIREISPRWVVGENVLGLINWSNGLVFHEVQTDLEAAGYEVWPYVLPACGIGASHKRDRVWFIAHANQVRLSTAKEIGEMGGQRPCKHHERFQWDILDLKSAIRREDDGVSRKLDEPRNQALGNAIAPGIALQIFEAIEQYEKCYA